MGRHPCVFLSGRRDSDYRSHGESPKTNKTIHVASLSTLLVSCSPILQSITQCPCLFMCQCPASPRMHTTARNSITEAFRIAGESPPVLLCLGPCLRKAKVLRNRRSRYFLEIPWLSLRQYRIWRTMRSVIWTSAYRPREYFPKTIACTPNFRPSGPLTTDHHGLGEHAITSNKAC